MHYLTLFAMVAVMTASYLVELQLAPQPVKFIPEILTAIVAIYVVLAGVRTRFHLVRAPYWIFFGATALIALCGIVANSVDTGPVIAGMRFYLRAIPFFLLPAVYPFKDWQIRQQLYLLAGLSLLQLPLSVYQRYALLQEGRFTGDYVYGTLMLSGTLSIFLIAAICIALAFMIRGRMSKWMFACLFLLLVLPTTINETKITVFLLPISLIATMMILAQRGKRLRMLGVATFLLFVAGIIFVPIYDYLGRQNVATKDAMTLMDVFTDKDYLRKYMDQGSSVGTRKNEVGRVDALTVPISILASDPVIFAFGYGLGNASLSSLGSQFTGAYGPLLYLYSSASTAGNLLLELGWFGFICAIGLHWLIFRDSLTVARESNDLLGAVAAAWAAIAILATMSLFYSPTIFFESISYLFWYFSGLIAARRAQLVYEAAAQVPRMLRARATGIATEVSARRSAGHNIPGAG